MDEDAFSQLLERIDQQLKEMKARAQAIDTQDLAQFEQDLRQLQAEIDRAYDAAKSWWPNRVRLNRIVRSRLDDVRLEFDLYTAPISVEHYTRISHLETTLAQAQATFENLSKSSSDQIDALQTQLKQVQNELHYLDRGWSLDYERPYLYQKERDELDGRVCTVRIGVVILLLRLQRLTDQ